jgi:hypothetical protein
MYSCSQRDAQVFGMFSTTNVFGDSVVSFCQIFSTTRTHSLLGTDPDNLVTLIAFCIALMVWKLRHQQAADFATLSLS